MNPITLKEFRELQEGEIIHIIFPGGGRASPWMVVNAKIGEVHHLPTDRDLCLSKVGIRQEDTRVYVDDPNPPLLSYEEFLNLRLDTQVFFVGMDGFLRVARKKCVNRYGDVFHMLTFPNGSMCIPYRKTINSGDQRIWIDTFHERQLDVEAG